MLPIQNSGGTTPSSTTTATPAVEQATASQLKADRLVLSEKAPTGESKPPKLKAWQAKLEGPILTLGYGAMVVVPGALGVAAVAGALGASTVALGSLALGGLWVGAFAGLLGLANLK